MLNFRSTKLVVISLVVALMMLSLLGCNTNSTVEGRAFLIGKGYLSLGTAHVYSLELVQADSQTAQVTFTLRRLPSQEVPNNDSWIVDWKASCTTGCFPQSQFFPTSPWSAAPTVDWYLAGRKKPIEVTLFVEPDSERDRLRLHLFVDNLNNEQTLHVMSTSVDLDSMQDSVTTARVSVGKSLLLIDLPVQK